MKWPLNAEQRTTVDKGLVFFYLLLGATLAAILLTHPFLRYPYDAWEHLIGIDEFRLSRLSPERAIWHRFWKELFDSISIESSQVFLRARIIHVSQTLFSFFAVYLFSKVLIRNIFARIDPLSLRYMAYWSTLIWFTIFATFSVNYHLIWMLWYSVTYQITLPLFWYILALTIITIFEPISWGRKLFYLLQILVISRLILQMHSMEYFYYLMYIFVLSLVYWRALYGFIKKHYMIVLPFVLAIFYFAKRYQPEHSQLLTLLWNRDFSGIYHAVITYGERLQTGANRSWAAYNELMTLSLLLGAIMLYLLWRRKGEEERIKVDKKMYLYLFLTSLFVLLPLNTVTGGILAVITRMDVVHRFYFSASLFVLIPVTFYYFITLYYRKSRIVFLNLMIATTLAATLLYSKYLSATHNYADNIHSIVQSFHGDVLAFNLSDRQIDEIGRRLKQYEQKYDDGRLIVYFARPDIAIVILMVYRQKVFWWGRRANVSLEDFQKELQRKGQADFNTVIFKTPEDFPKYIPYQ